MQFNATHQGHSFSQAGSNPTYQGAGGGIGTSRLRFENPAYSTFSASVGIAKDAWNVELYGQNITNVNKSTFTSTTQFVPAEVITRPRVLGIRFGYKFGG